MESLRKQDCENRKSHKSSTCKLSTETCSSGVLVKVEGRIERDDGEKERDMKEFSCKNESSEEDLSSFDEEDYVPRKRKRAAAARKSKSKETPKAFSKEMPQVGVAASSVNMPVLSLKIIPMPVGKRQSLSLKEKISIIERIKNGEGQNKVATNLKLNRSTIQNIWANREKFEKEAAQGQWEKKKCRRPNNAELDSLVLSWVEHMKAKGTPANGTQIREHAKILARGLGDEDFTASHGWLSHFKLRNRVILPKSRKHGKMLQEIKAKEELRDRDNHTEKDDLDHCEDFTSDYNDTVEDFSQSLQFPAAASKSTPNLHSRRFASVRKVRNKDWLAGIWPQLCEGYHPQDVYFTSEFGLFHQATPEHYTELQGMTCSDGECPTERLSILFGVNALGTERLKLVLVGGKPRPSSFGENWNQDLHQDKLPTEYWFHPKAFLTPDIISSWLSRWNKQIQTASGNGRTSGVLLVMTNSKVHQMVQSLCSGLEFIKIVIPTETGAQVFKSMGNEIAAEMRLLYRKLMVDKLIREQQIENKRLNLSMLDICGLLHTSWIAMEPNVIKGIFKKAGLVKGGNAEIKKTCENRNTIRRLVQQARAAGLKFPKELGFQSFVDVDASLIAVDTSGGIMVENRSSHPSTGRPACVIPPSTHEILNCLDHLRRWSVANQSGDLSALHLAISTLHSYCANLSHQNSSKLPHLNRIVSLSPLKSHHATPSEQATPLLTQYHQTPSEVVTPSTSTSGFLATVDPRPIINITLPVASVLPQSGNSVTSTPSSSSNIYSFQNSFGNTNMGHAVSQSNHTQQVNFIISNGQINSSSSSDTHVLTGTTLHHQSHHHHLVNQYFGN